MKCKTVKSKLGSALGVGWVGLGGALGWVWGCIGGRLGYLGGALRVPTETEHILPGLKISGHLLKVFL